MYKMILNGSLLLAGAIFAQMTAQAQAQNTETSDGIGYTIHPGEPGRPATEYIEINKGGKAYRIVRNGGDKVKEFYIDDRRIPDDSIANYRSVIKEIDEEVRLDRERSEQDELQARKDEKEADIDAQQASMDRQQAELDRQQTEIERQQAMFDRQRAEKDKQEAERDMQQAENDKEMAEKDKRVAEKGIQFYKQQLRDLASDLVEDHIIDSKSDLTGMGLSDQELIVNGRRQPDSVHQRYKKKYLRQPGMGLYYGKVDLGNGVYFEKKDLRDL